MCVVRDSGLRLTAARRLVIESLLKAQQPISAEAIARGVGELPGSDLATVYRNLETLEALGIVRHFHAGHGAGLYVLEGRDHQEYLACEACGRVTCVDPSALDDVRDAILKLSGFRAAFSHFPIFGTCPDCTRQPSVARPKEKTHA